MARGITPRIVAVSMDTTNNNEIELELELDADVWQMACAFAAEANMTPNEFLRLAVIELLAAERAAR